MLQVNHVAMITGYLFTFVVTAEAGSGATLAPSQHSVGSVPTSQAVIVAVATGTSAIKTAFPKTILTKVHGILMLIAWPLLAVTGIFFAAWMKPALGPPPMPPKWFTVSFRAGDFGAWSGDLCDVGSVLFF